MPEVMATLTSKGQITLPAAVRLHLGVRVGDRIIFVIEPDGGVRVKVPRFASIQELRGAVGSFPRPMEWEEMKAVAYENRLVARYRRESGAD
jgi:antitoxin PrlF